MTSRRIHGCTAVGLKRRLVFSTLASRYSPGEDSSACSSRRENAIHGENFKRRTIVLLFADLSRNNFEVGLLLRAYADQKAFGGPPAALERLAVGEILLRAHDGIAGPAACIGAAGRAACRRGAGAITRNRERPDARRRLDIAQIGFDLLLHV